MGIESRIRSVLEGLEFPGQDERRYALMVNAALGKAAAPARIEEDFDGHGPRRAVYELFRQAGCMRAVPRFEGEIRQLESYVRRQFLQWKTFAARDLQVGLTPVMAVWYHWILLVGEKSLGIPADRDSLQRLWIAGFSEQRDDGRLLCWDARESIDAKVYDELTAIHAAYNSAKMLGDASMMEQVRPVVRWHVENTQPDNTTNEPWGLAAFAALDESGTFAEQQVHDAVVQLRNGPAGAAGVPITVGLLADALLTLEG